MKKPRPRRKRRSKASSAETGMDARSVVNLEWLKDSYRHKTSTALVVFTWLIPIAIIWTNGAPSWRWYALWFATLLWTSLWALAFWKLGGVRFLERLLKLETLPRKRR